MLVRVGESEKVTGKWNSKGINKYKNNRRLGSEERGGNRCTKD